jgi:hypothetical protein
MNLAALLTKLKKQPATVEFDEVMGVIDSTYTFTPTVFTNGELSNEADTNNGSCKIFAFGQLNGLDEAQTLACFGTYYRDDVLKQPEGDNHGNIRNFMKTGWNGIRFESEPLRIKYESLNE